MSPRENHRERLIEGALQCLREKGYARTTARDVAAAGGANLGSIGYHFGSKEALLAEALGEGFRQWTQFIAQRVLAQGGATPYDRLRVLWSAALESFEDQGDLMLAFVEALPEAARSDSLRRRLAEHYADVRQVTMSIVESEAEAAGGLDEDAVQAVATLVVAVVDGLVLQWLLDRERVPTAEALTGAVDALLRIAAGPVDDPATGTASA